jgi:hypothetical protein
VLPFGRLTLSFGHLDLSLPTRLVTLSIVTSPSRWFLRTGMCFAGPVWQHRSSGISGGSRYAIVRSPWVDVPRDAAGPGVHLCTEQAPPVSAVQWRSSWSIADSLRRSRASDLGSVTLGSPLDPVVGGSLEDAFCCLI